MKKIQSFISTRIAKFIGADKLFKMAAEEMDKDSELQDAMSDLFYHQNKLKEMQETFCDRFPDSPRCKNYIPKKEKLNSSTSILVSSEDTTNNTSEPKTKQWFLNNFYLVLAWLLFWPIGAYGSYKRYEYNKEIVN